MTSSASEWQTAGPAPNLWRTTTCLGALHDTAQIRQAHIKLLDLCHKGLPSQVDPLNDLLAVALDRAGPSVDLVKALELLFDFADRPIECLKVGLLCIVLKSLP